MRNTQNLVILLTLLFNINSTEAPRQWDELQAVKNQNRWTFFQMIVHLLFISGCRLCVYASSSVFFPRPPADFELAQLQDKLRETELVMENIVNHSPDRWGVTSSVSRITFNAFKFKVETSSRRLGFGVFLLFVFQGGGRDGGPGGESPAAADGDHPRDAGGPASGPHGAGGEDPGGLGRWEEAELPSALNSTLSHRECFLKLERRRSYTTHI